MADRRIGRGLVVSIRECSSLFVILTAASAAIEDTFTEPTDKFVEEYCDGYRWIHTKPECMKRKTAFALLEYPEWKTRYESCGDAVQSPIHVRYLDSQYRQFKVIYYTGFEHIYSYIVENGVHGLYMTLMDGTVSIYGGPLAVRYNLSRVILRFGRSKGPGSEHRIDSEEYVAEGHWTRPNLSTYMQPWSESMIGVTKVARGGGVSYVHVPALLNSSNASIQAVVVRSLCAAQR